ncbi:MAG TPA: hypothetical protein P5205_15855 [Candidatus Paceibacterota bacterium]|nr:hypothetical protein [Verrucomicrobiota bacterium]HSA11836.1 hypothetical protein [Candidatus Paceibacterota bacterium]
MRNRLDSMRCGAVQTHRNIALVPLIAKTDGTFQYCTLNEALANWDVAITEVSAAGSVPELKIVNRGHMPVLLIDGEELAGARQNRAVNCSILLRELCAARIPVSSTEQGRWAYSSSALRDSGHVMAHKSRALKAHSVLRSLEKSGVHHSNQAEVWESVAECVVKAGIPSPTSAMSDVFKARESDLQRCIEAFPCLPGQVGLLAIINGQPAGADVVSRTSAYAKLHPKLVQSYSLEGLLASEPKTITPDAAETRSREFLAEIMAAEARRFPSIGYGADVRFRAKALTGTALVHDNEVIHAAFFRVADANGAKLRSRRRSHRAKRT